MRYSHLLHLSRKKNILSNKKYWISIATVAFLLLIVIFLVIFSNLNSFDLLVGFLVSLFRVSVAYLIALVLALTIALLITSSAKIENIMLPIFDVFQSFPSFALFPALVIAFHSTELIIILVLVIALIWPMMFSIIGGIKNRREDLEEAATIFGAKGFKRLNYFTLPELSPSITTGSIVGWGDAWELIIGAELLVNTNIGIGHYLGNLGKNGENFLLTLGIVALMLLLFLINKILWLPMLYKTTKYQSE